MNRVPSSEPLPVVRIEALAAGGRGVARHDGMVWFVQGGLPGDVVRVETVRRRRRFVEARVVGFERVSNQRRAPACPVQARCGGCPWMPLDESAQRVWKQRLVADALVRIGGFAEGGVERIRTPTTPLGYRNRVEFTVVREAARPPIVGFRTAGGGPGGVVDVDSCALQHAEGNRVLATLRERLRALPVRAAVRTPRPGDRRLTIRRSSSTGQILIAFRGPVAPMADLRRLSAEIMRSHPDVVGIVHLTSTSGRRGGTRTTVLAGTDRIEERVAGMRLVLPASSFLQVSAAGAEALVELVGESIGDAGSQIALDLYGGVGLFGRELLRRGARQVTVCDADAEAVACGRAIDAGTGTGHLRFVHADVGRFLHGAGPAGRTDLVVANPPRAGVGSVVARWLSSCGAARIVMVSCDPATLARDLREVVSGGTYRLGRVVPVDMFPQTAHVEAVAVLSRLPSGVR